MSARPLPAKMPPMTDKGPSRLERGRSLQRWVEANDIKIARLARHAGIRSRDTVYNAFRGEAGEATYERLEAARAYITAHPNDEPEGPQMAVSTEQGIIEVELNNIYGVERIAVRGPAGNVADLEALAQRVIEQIRRGQEESD